MSAANLMWRARTTCMLSQYNSISALGRGIVGRELIIWRERSGKSHAPLPHLFDVRWAVDSGSGIYPPGARVTSGGSDLPRLSAVLGCNMRRTFCIS